VGWCRSMVGKMPPDTLDDVVRLHIIKNQLLRIRIVGISKAKKDM
jgi:hypothetical protein